MKADDLSVVRNPGASIHFKSASLTLREKVAMNFYLTGETEGSYAATADGSLTALTDAMMAFGDAAAVYAK